MEAGKKAPSGEKLPSVSVNTIEQKIEELFHLLDLDEGRGIYPQIIVWLSLLIDANHICTCAFRFSSI